MWVELPVLAPNGDLAFRGWAGAALGLKDARVVARRTPSPFSVESAMDRLRGVRHEQRDPLNP